MTKRKTLSDIQVVPDAESGDAVLIIETDDGAVIEVEATAEQLDDLADAIDLFAEAGLDSEDEADI